MQVNDPYVPGKSLHERVRRKWTALRSVAPLNGCPSEFILSVSFDDVPLSAATRGADILASHGMTGTFYSATGLMGGASASGQIAGPDDLRTLSSRGHEVALHGHGHHDMTRMTPEAAIADIRRNRDTLAQILGAAPCPHFAYPYGETTIGLKKRLLAEVPSARGIVPGSNRTGTDAMQLVAHDLRMDATRLAAARRGMTLAARTGGWVILFTHDVAPEPSPYGVTPRTLDDLLGQATRLGARLLPVGQAWTLVSRGPQENGTAL
ncbi:polysaccharide deacetylase family protein [Roseovarius salis]|uniref:polysaccharide deacetylase family protein n=1 Tax=Roseovarius salis TaxID=3376063 RepID=UPI0037CAA429